MLKTLMKTKNQTQPNIFFVADIDECQIPELSRKCVENAECCNLPAEYVCKCKPGFEGDGQVECRGELSAGMKIPTVPSPHAPIVAGNPSLRKPAKSLGANARKQEMGHLSANGVARCRLRRGWLPSASRGRPLTLTAKKSPNFLGQRSVLG